MRARPFIYANVYVIRSLQAEQVSRLERIASAMRRGEVTEDVLEVCPELALSYKQNEKLKYRKIILQRVGSVFVIGSGFYSAHLYPEPVRTAGFGQLTTSHLVWKA